MKAKLQNYRNGIDVVPSHIVEDIISTFSEHNEAIGLYQISDFRKDVLKGLKVKGWSDNLVLDNASKISITGEKDGFGLCLQTGNVSRIYADLLKLQTLYVNGRIKAGIIIVPTKGCAKEYTSNAATFERLTKEMSIFSKVITSPLVIIGFYN